jgi:hypothetical protein
MTDGTGQRTFQNILTQNMCRRRILECCPRKECSDAGFIRKRISTRIWGTMANTVQSILGSFLLRGCLRDSWRFSPNQKDWIYTVSPHTQRILPSHTARTRRSKSQVNPIWATCLLQCSLPDWRKSNNRYKVPCSPQPLEKKPTLRLRLRLLYFLGVGPLMSPPKTYSRP